MASSANTKVSPSHGRTTTTAPNFPPLEKGPLRVLLFTSLPDDVDPENSRLDVEEEQVQVQEALNPWIAEGLVQLEMPEDGRFSTLKELLKTFQPHLVFLSGHGKFTTQKKKNITTNHHTGEPPFGVFLFESETGKSHPVSRERTCPGICGNGRAMCNAVCLRKRENRLRLAQQRIGAKIECAEDPPRSGDA